MEGRQREWVGVRMRRGWGGIGRDVGALFSKRQREREGERASLRELEERA